MADDYRRSELDGYRRGEMERDALAAHNSDLRSDLLLAQKEIQRLQAVNDSLQRQILDVVTR